MYTPPKLDLKNHTNKEQAFHLVVTKLSNLLAGGTAKSLEITLGKGVKGKFLRPNLVDFLKT